MNVGYLHSILHLEIIYIQEVFNFIYECFLGVINHHEYDASLNKTPHKKHGTSLYGYVPQRQ